MSRTGRGRRQRFDSGNLLHIAADAAVANDVVEGKLVPLVILDTTRRPDVEELIRVHEFLPPGDVASQWAGFGNDVLLVLKFLQPVATDILIPFILQKGHGLLIDSTLESRALYIQAGRPGDRLKHDVNRPKLLMHIPDTGFDRVWERLYLKFMINTLIRDKGMRRTEANLRGQELIDELRQITRLRMRR